MNPKKATHAAIDAPPERATLQDASDRLSRRGRLAPDVAAIWQPVIARRVEEIRRSHIEGVPGDVVAERIRRIVGR